MQRLVSMELVEGRETPLLLLASLRELDPTVELVYVGQRVWWVGSVRKTQERIAKAQRILENESHRSPANPRNIMLGKLGIQGFAMVCQYRGPDPSGTVEVEWANPEASYHTTILEDFRARVHEYETDLGARVMAERAFASANGPAQLASAIRERDFIHTDARDHRRRIIKDRKTFGHGGMTGGTEQALIVSPGQYAPSHILTPEQVLAEMASLAGIPLE